MRVKSFDSTRVFCWRASNLQVHLDSNNNNIMECKILFWMPLLLLSVCVNVGNGSALEGDDCYWSGEGPICDGKCRPGETASSESHKNDGNGCITGKKKYCCKTGVATVASVSTNVTAESDSLAPVKPQLDQQVTNSSTGTTTNSSNSISSSTKDDCYWVGKSPNCVGSCREGDYMAITSRTGNGSTCIVGKKKYCCKGSNVVSNDNDNKTLHHLNVVATATTTTSTTTKQVTNNGNSSACYWIGHPPICLGSCKFGDYVTEKSPTGDGGSKCESGQKKLCCPRQKDSTAAMTTDEETDHKKTVRDDNRQRIDSISNSTIGPFQAWRRPTPRAQPINSTVKNHLKIVKIKRKLATSTPTSETLLTLPSTTSESTTTTTESAVATIPTTSAATSSTFIETESTSVATASSTSLPEASPSSSTSTMPTTTSTSIKPATTIVKPFFNLPDVLPVPLIFRLIRRPTIEESTETARQSSIIQSSTTSAATTTTSVNSA